MHTMSFHTPNNKWYIDTDAISHTTESQGNLSSYSPLSNSNQKVIVGSGQKTPIHNIENTEITTYHQPVHLNHVLHAQKIIKILIFARRLITNNNVSFSFNPFGFNVSDFQMGIPLIRFDRCDGLYLVTTPSSFAGLTSSLWHNHFGHPSVSVLNSLCNNKLI